MGGNDRVLSTDDYPTDHHSPWIDDLGFLRVRTGKKRRTRAALEHDLALASALAADGLLRTIWDARAAQVFDTDAWVPLIKRLNSIVSALAVLISDTTTSHAQTFGEQINVLLLPCRVFTDETEAVAWLSSLEG